MRAILSVLFSALAVSSSSVYGLARHPLNVAQDPETLDGAIYGKALDDLDLRVGPSEEFDVITSVPADSEIPIIGWLSGAEGESLWIRTWLGDKRGWLCAFDGNRRLIERDGNALFPLVVVADGLLFRTERSDRNSRFAPKEIRLEEGSELEFISVCDNESFSPYFYDCRVFVKCGNYYGSVNIYGNEPKRELKGSTITTEPRPWAVSCPPEFTELSLEYNYGTGLFEFVGPEEYRAFYSGPGFEFENMGPYFVIVDTVFVDEPWALVKVWSGFGWVYMGSTEAANIQTYSHCVDYALCDYPPPVSEEGEGEVEVSIKMTRWPTKDKVYVEFNGPYFSADYIENTVVEKIRVFQPPTNETPLYSGRPTEIICSSWHETGFNSYGVTLPEGFASGEPFRVLTNMSFQKVHKFEMEFLCNEGR